MNVTNAKIWIDALRSDAYDQTFGCIARGSNRRCCLGVAHECLIGPINAGEDDRMYDDDACNMYNDVRKALGIDLAQEAEFIHLNDVDKKSFSDIAAVIESQITPQLEDSK